MLSVSSMALAAMLGSACGTNVTNISDCNVTPYNTGDCPQAIQYQKGGWDPNSMLLQMGIGMVPGNSQCDVS